MLKKLLISTFYAAIVFCVVSYASVMISLLSTVGTNQKPVANLGFPFKYYYQFWLRGNDSPNCGWNIHNFYLDVVITWIVVTIIYLKIKKNK